MAHGRPADPVPFAPPTASEGWGRGGASGASGVAMGARAVVDDAISKVVELQSIFDEGAESLQSGVCVRFCKTQKGLYETLHNLKELVGQEEPEEATSDNLLVRRFFRTELSWAGLSCLLRDEQEVDWALEAMNELLLSDNQSRYARRMEHGDERWAVVRRLVRVVANAASPERAGRAMVTARLLLTSATGSEAMKIEFHRSSLMHEMLGWISDANASEHMLEITVDLISELIDNCRPWYTRILESAALLKALLAHYREPTTIFRVRNRIAGLFYTLVQVSHVDGAGNFLGPLNDLARDLLAAGAESITDHQNSDFDDVAYHNYAVDLIHELVCVKDTLVKDLVDLGGVAILLDAFYDASDDDRVKIMSIIEVAAEERSLHYRLVNLDVYKVCATALRRHSKVTEITSRACHILRDLTRDPRSRHVLLLREAKIPRIIVDFLFEDANYVVRSNAMSVLRNLCDIVSQALNNDLQAAGALALLKRTLRDKNCVDSHSLALEALDNLMALPHGSKKRPNTRARKREREA